MVLLHANSATAALSHEQWITAFLRFVDWPVNSISNVLTVCYLPSATPLVLDDLSVRGIVLKARPVATPRESGPCNVLYLANAQGVEIEPWLRGFHDRPVLTIGRGDQFCDLGGGICLLPTRKESTASYRINVNALNKVGLRASAQLRATPKAISVSILPQSED
jgi:hypothetical protein